MLIALVADFHGNRPATEALEKDLALTKPDRVLCLGDMVGKGPSSDFTCDWARAHCEYALGGNWDYGIGRKQFEPDGFYWEQLGKERLAYLSALPTEREEWWSGRRVRLFHGRPVMDELITVRDSSEAIMPLFQSGDDRPYDAVIYADAHRQALRTMSPGLFVNIGSVGNALGVPMCCYALADVAPGRDPAPFEIRLRQVEYDREQAARDAENAPLLPRAQAYIREVTTGVYSRKGIVEKKVDGTFA